MSGGRHHHVGLFLFDIWGAYSAWVYLRFFQPHGSGVRGDDSADFAFAALFPPVARPVIARVSAPVGAAAQAIAERRRLAREASNATTTTAARPPPANTAADAAVRAKLEQKSSVVAPSTRTPTRAPSANVSPSAVVARSPPARHARRTPSTHRPTTLATERTLSSTRSLARVDL